LKENNWKMNGSGEIKGTQEQLLEQSSTLADLCMINFNEEAKEIPSCYYEFALRYPMEELYQGLSLLLQIKYSKYGCKVAKY
jgi:hypothetical protein